MIQQIMEFAREYARLGSALQEQFDTVLALNINDNNFNTNAARYLTPLLEQLYDICEGVDEPVYEIEQAIEGLDDYMRGGSPFE